MTDLRRVANNPSRNNAMTPTEVCCSAGKYACYVSNDTFPLSLLTLCLCSFTHSVCWPFWVCVCVCVRACVSECPAPCVGVSECPAPCVGEFATDFLKATQWYPAVTKATEQISQILCISLQHVLGVSRRCVFLNHSLEWILKFTVNRDSVGSYISDNVSNAGSTKSAYRRPV